MLLVRGDWDKIEEFQRQAGLRNAPDSRYAQEQDQPRMMVEIDGGAGQRGRGPHLAETGIKWRYDAVALAIHRRGQVLRNKLSEVSWHWVTYCWCWCRRTP